MRSLTVPFDIVFYLLGNMSLDSTTVAACALVSRCWLHVCRQILYRRLRLDLLKLGDGFRDFFYRRAKICSLVRELHLHGGLLFLDTKARLSSCCIANVISLLPHLEVLELTAISFVSCPLTTLHTCMPITPYCHLRRFAMTRVISTTDRTNPMEVLRSAVDIQHMTLFDIQWIGAGTRPVPASCIPYQPLPVERLTTLFHNPIRPDFTTLPIVRDVRTIECFNVHPGTCVNLVRLLTATKDSLECLYLAVQPSRTSIYMLYAYYVLKKYFQSLVRSGRMPDCLSP